MDEQNERVIDLKWLFYRALGSWRKAVVCGIILAIVLGLGSLGLKLLSMSNEEAYEASRISFEREHASWVATEHNLLIQMENLDIAKERQTEYNEKSIMMEIDPLRKNIASFELFVDYPYEILPGSSVQNSDKSNWILAQYATYATNGELYHYIINNLNYDIELRYLTEIFGVSVNYSNKTISVTVVHKDKTACQEILDLALAALLARETVIEETISEGYDVTLSNESAYETVDLNLQDTQKANIEYLTRLDLNIQEVNEVYAEWKLEPEPVWEYSVSQIVKSTISMMLIGGLVGVLLVLIVAAVAKLLSGKLLNPADMKNRFNVRLIGCLPRDRKTVSCEKVEKWVDKVGGITTKPEDYISRAKMIGSSIRSDIGSREDATAWETIAFTGMASIEEIQNAVEAMGINDAYSIICAPDVLTNAGSIEAVSAADCIVLVEKQENTAITDIEKELEALKAWNKPVLGAVVINSDATM